MNIRSLKIQWGKSAVRPSIIADHTSLKAPFNNRAKMVSTSHLEYIHTQQIFQRLTQTIFSKISLNNYIIPMSSDKPKAVRFSVAK